MVLVVQLGHGIILNDVIVSIYDAAILKQLFIIFDGWITITLFV